MIKSPYIYLPRDTRLLLLSMQSIPHKTAHQNRFPLPKFPFRIAFPLFECAAFTLALPLLLAFQQPLFLRSVSCFNLSYQEQMWSDGKVVYAYTTHTSKSVVVDTEEP